MAWLGTWAYRRKITVAASDVDEGQSDFPILLKLSISAGKTGVNVTDIFDEVGANRLKIAITSSNGTTQLYVESVEWDDTGETAEIHFKATSLSSGSVNEFYIYYDNTQADNTTYVGVVGSTPGETVWDSTFVLVMHLAETAGNYLDSTSNDNDSNVIDVTSRTRTGLIGQNSPDWVRANTDGGIQIPDAAELRLTDHTLEIIVYHDSWEAAEFPDMLWHNDGAGAWYSLEITNSPYEIRHRWHNAGNNFQDYAVDVTTGSWCYIAGTADTTSLTASGFHNAETPDVDTAINTPLAGGASFTGIGYDPSSYYLDGSIDEVRISNIARTAAWMDATNLTLKDNFVTFGAEEPLSSSSSSTSLSSSSSSSESESSSSKSSSSSSESQHVDLELQWTIDTYCSDDQWVIDTYCADQQWIPQSSSSSSSSSSVSFSSSSSSATPATKVWGHQTGTEEDHQNTFVNNWTTSGGWTPSGSGDDEVLQGECGGVSISQRWYLGAFEATIFVDKYQTGSGTPVVYYKTATTGAGLSAASWTLYNGVSFTSLGWVKLKVVN